MVAGVLGMAHWNDVSQSVSEVVVVMVDVGHLLLDILLGDEVENLRHLPVLNDGHPLDAMTMRLPFNLAFQIQVLHRLAADGTAHLAQTVEVGQGRHGDDIVWVFLLNARAEKEAKLQVFYVLSGQDLLAGDWPGSQEIINHISQQPIRISNKILAALLIVVLKCLGEKKNVSQNSF